MHVNINSKVITKRVNIYQAVIMLSNDMNAQVSDTTKPDSSTKARYKTALHIW